MILSTLTNRTRYVGAKVLARCENICQKLYVYNIVDEGHVRGEELK